MPVHSFFDTISSKNLNLRNLIFDSSYHRDILYRENSPAIALLSRKKQIELLRCFKDFRGILPYEILRRKRFISRKSVLKKLYRPTQIHKPCSKIERRSLVLSEFAGCLGEAFADFRSPRNIHHMVEGFDRSHACGETQSFKFLLRQLCRSHFET